ncbi:MAG: hypothetical protein KIT14_08510 [bacterium]|nr:hypothetical protein [bacterium]
MRAVSWLAGALLALAATAYLAFGLHLGLEWIDEGHIVYPAWRVARGELPYRDFQQLYGPSVFVLNGALLRLFGEELAVVRAGLLAVKLLLGALVFVLARDVAGRGLALAVTAAFVVIWGTPIWVFNAPYANHYALACQLLAVAVLLRGRARPLVAALVAGVLVGVGMTFKQTAGVFAAVTVALFLLAPDRTQGEPAWRRLLWWAAVLATAGVVVAYLRERTPAALVLALPLAGLVAVAAGRGGGDRGGGVRAQPFAALLVFAAGAALAPVAVGVVFAAEGTLGRLLADTLLELPQRVAWFIPLKPPDVRGWFGAGTFGLVLWLPVFVPLAAVPLLAARRSGPGGDAAPWLLAWTAAGCCLAMYPAADMPHALMLLPALLPLLAWALAVAAGPRGVRRAAVLALAAAIAVAILRTPVQQARAVIAAPIGPTLPRAAGIRTIPVAADDNAALLALLAKEPAERELLILPSEQMTYFLAGRRAALQDREYVLYLATTGFVHPEDARAAFDEEGAIARLVATRPLVIEHDVGPYLARVRTMFPTLAAFLDKYYRERERAGRYTVLEPVMGPAGQVDSSLVPPAPPSPPGALPH